MDGKIFTRMDPAIYRSLKLKTCLKNWTAKDDNNNPVEVTPENIDNLNPDVAQAIIDAFERVTELSSEDIKK